MCNKICYNLALISVLKLIFKMNYYIFEKSMSSGLNERFHF